MTEDELLSEIHSVFQVPMGGNDRFAFDVLQSTGGQNKALVVLSLSSSLKWTASALAPKNVKTPIYIIVREPLKVCVTCSVTNTFFTSLIQLPSFSHDNSSEGKDGFPVVDLTGASAQGSKRMKSPGCVSHVKKETTIHCSSSETSLNTSPVLFCCHHESLPLFQCSSAASTVVSQPWHLYFLFISATC